MKAAVLSMFLLFTFCDDSGTAPSGCTHDWGDWLITTPASCDAQGVETRTCKKNASHTETRAISQLTGLACDPEHEHDHGDWETVKEAACSSPGQRKKECECGHTLTEEIPQLTGSACGSNNGGDGNDNNNAGSELILGENEAWVDNASAGNRDGYIFRADGTVLTINDYNGHWEIDGTLEWSVVGNQLIFKDDGDEEAFNYTLVNNQFTVTIGGFPYVHTKTSNVTFGGGGDGGNNDPAQLLVNASGTAWVGVQVLAGRRHGFILRANGTYTGIRDSDLGLWYVNGAGNWSVSGNNLHLDGRSGESNYQGNRPYELSNGNNTLQFGGIRLTRWTGVTVTMGKILAKGMLNE